MHTSTTLIAVRVCLMYALFASLWILLSDRVIDLMVADPLKVTALQSIKGVAFVVVTALLLFGHISAELRQRARVEQALVEERALLAQRVEERTAELSAANSELSRALRLKDEFLSTMSHELRTPLNAILGRSESLQESIYGPLSERQAAAVRSIEESGRHLLALINDILDISRIDAGRLELELGPVPLDELCRESLLLVQQQARAKQLAVTTVMDQSVGVVQLDARRVRQILMNLLSNAVKFTPTGGSIGVELRGDPQTERIELTVWDTGIGIAQADQQHLFRPFAQVDSSLTRKTEGAGLGLALVARLAELHGGSVALQSTLGKGSRVTVSLPWQRQQQRTAARAPAPAPTAAPGDGASVLIAEDNEATLSLMQDYLQALGYRVRAARNGDEAVAAAQEAVPAVVVMDVQMPGMDGLEAMRLLRASPATADVPIIAVTALAMPGDRERCLEAGASEYLSKPVALKVLVGTIETQLRYRSTP